MLYTVANFGMVAPYLKGLSASPTGCVDMSSTNLTKVGRKGPYPGGLVFVSKHEAVESLRRVILYEYDPRGPYAKMKEMEARLFTIEGDHTDCYSHRGGLRLNEDKKFIEMMPDGGMRYAFTSATLRWSEADDFLKEVQDVFPDEPWLRYIIPEIRLMSTWSSPSAKTCFIVEGPLTERHLLAKLKLAG